MSSPRPALAIVPPVGRVEGVACNLCGAVRQAAPSQSFEDLRALLRGQGWLCRDDIDVCSPCRAKL